MAKFPPTMSEETQAELDRYFHENRAEVDVIFRHPREELVKHFRFLDELRESGAVNMFGAPPVLAEAFGLSDADAKAIWSRWASTFAKFRDVEYRVALAEGWRGHEGFFDWRERMPQRGGEND